MDQRYILSYLTFNQRPARNNAIIRLTLLPILRSFETTTQKSTISINIILQFLTELEALKQNSEVWGTGIQCLTSAAVYLKC